jgi:U2 small nuclear ribonucleoprotein B''
VEYIDEGSAGVAKDALHNYKLDGENKIKVCSLLFLVAQSLTILLPADYIREEVMYRFYLSTGLLFLRCTT